MFKVAYNQILKDWKSVVGVMLALFVTAVLLTTFITLGGTAIIDQIQNTAESVAPTIIFNAITGITLLIAALAISVTAIQSIRRRHRQFMLLRIVGSTYGQIRGAIFAEIVMLMVVTFAIGTPIGLYLADAVASYLIDQKSLTAAFVVRKEWFFPFISFAVSLFIAFFVAAITIRDFRFVSLTGRKESSKTKKIVLIVLGFLVLFGGLGFLLARTFQEGAVDAITLIAATISFAIAMMILGPYALRFVFNRLAKLFKRRPLLSMAFSSSAYGMANLITPIVVVASGVLIVATSSVFSSASTKATFENNGPIYANIRSGVDLTQRDVTINSDLSAFDQANPAQKTVISAVAEIYSPTTQGSLTARAFQSVASVFTYQLKNVDGNPADIYGGPNNVAVMNAFDAKGSSLELAIDGKNAIFNVVATYDRPFKNGSGTDVLIPAVLLNYANPAVRADPAFAKVAYVVSSDESLKALGGTYPLYDPYFANEFAANVTTTASLLFGIVFGTFIAVIGINSIAIYVTDRKKEFKLSRVVSHTLGDVWKQFACEWAIFVGVIVACVTVYLGIFSATFAKSNLLALSGSDAGWLALIVCLGILLSLVAYVGSMVALNKRIAKVNMSSQ